MSGLKEAIETLRDAVDDLTSLHVQTYTGVIDFTSQDGVGFDNLREKVLTAEAKEKLNVHLAYETLIKFDGDSYNFVNQDQVSDKVAKVHKDAVEAGIKTRLGLLELAKEIVLK